MTNLQIAIKAARTAGYFLRRHYSLVKKQPFSLKYKSQIVTPADTGAEKIALNIIKKHSNLPILSEERGWVGKKSDSAWIVDPLDGSTNFTIGSPIFAVSIALIEHNQPQIACIYTPILNKTFTASKGQGAFIDKQKLKISTTNKISQSFITYCHGSSWHNIKRAMIIEKIMRLKALDVRQLGAASLELALVASGRTETIVIPGAHPWDVAAGVLLVTEAGGRVTDFANKPWHLGSKDMVATNNKIHDQILKLINQY